MGWCVLIHVSLFSLCLLRPYGDSHGMGQNEGNYNPKNRRDTQSYTVKTPFNWKDSRGRGRPPVVRRVPLMGEQREPRFNNMRSPNQDSFQSYSPKMEPHHSQRRPFVASRPNRPPHGHHPSSSRSPAQGSPGQRGPPFHGQPSGHRSPSPRHFRNHPADRRPSSSQAFQGSFRGHKRQPGFFPSGAAESRSSWEFQPQRTALWALRSWHEALERGRGILSSTQWRAQALWVTEESQRDAWERPVSREVQEWHNYPSWVKLLRRRPEAGPVLPITVVIMITSTLPQPIIIRGDKWGSDVNVLSPAIERSVTSVITLWKFTSPTWFILSCHYEGAALR